FRGNGLIPLFGVGEFRIDVEDHATEWEQAVAHHLADPETRRPDLLPHSKLPLAYVAQPCVHFNPKAFQALDPTSRTARRPGGPTISVRPRQPKNRCPGAVPRA